VTLDSLLPLDFRRRRRARSAPPGPLRTYYDMPFPPRSRDWMQVEFLALDLETTGSDPGVDEIVSAGWVRISGGAMDLGTATRRMVRPSGPMPEASAVIHAITDDEAAQGEPLRAVLVDILRALGGRVLVAHYARTELGFLDAACRRCLGGGLLVPVVDTLELARRRHSKAGREPARGEFRLDALRMQYNLPGHQMHDALSDAIAAAELFLAQAAELSATGALPLRTLLSRV
jgi:DNA polymerase III subunit epsilon